MELNNNEFIIYLLQEEADESCKCRGHKMKWAEPFFHNWSNSNLIDGICENCGMEAQCCDRPQPNGIDIGGEAVALNCTSEDKGV